MCTLTTVLSSTPLFTIGTHSEIIDGSGSPTLPTWLTDIPHGVRASSALSWSSWQFSDTRRGRKQAVCMSCVKLTLTAAAPWHCALLAALTVSQSEGLTETLTKDVHRRAVRDNSGSVGELSKDWQMRQFLRIIHATLSLVASKDVSWRSQSTELRHTCCRNCTHGQLYS